MTRILSKQPPPPPPPKIETKAPEKPKIEAKPPAASGGSTTTTTTTNQPAARNQTTNIAQPSGGASASLHQALFQRFAGFGAAVRDKATELAAQTQQTGETAPVGSIPSEPVTTDGTAQAALDYAWQQTQAETATGQNYARDGYPSLQDDPGAWNNYCQAFVSSAYHWGKDGDKNVIIPELRQPNAISSYNAFEENGKIQTEMPPPAGAIVFFEATANNGQDGHIAIATGETAPDGSPLMISSGWPGRDGVFTISLNELEQESGACLGYATVGEAQPLNITGTAQSTAASTTSTTDSTATDATTTTTTTSATTDPTEVGGTTRGAPVPTDTTIPTNPAGNVPQAWNNTCGANSLMSMEAAVDPARAEQLQGLQGEDRAVMEGAVLTSSGSFGTSHVSTRPGGSTEGWGTFEMRRQITDRFVGEAQVYEPQTRDDAVDQMINVLDSGRPVALGLDGHWMSATAIRDGENGREVQINDSWTGESVWVPEADLRQSGDHWIRTYLPDAPFPGRMLSLVYPETNQLDPNSSFRDAETSQGEAMQARYDQAYPS
ncbi:MAG: hypothetical protein H6728_12405 [Myxococcales bacterium]|nr:hypothetical protein [Myxococcales bacterium]